MYVEKFVVIIGEDSYNPGSPCCITRRDCMCLTCSSSFSLNKTTGPSTIYWIKINWVTQVILAET